jgi:hypothetical protein
VTTATSCVVTGLVNGQPYRFAVVSVNEVGTSDPSALSAAVTPATIPAAPHAEGTSSTDAAGSASWSVDSDDGGDPVVDVIVRLWWEGVVIREFATTLSEVAFDGLTNGETYRVTVAARNGVGESLPALVGVVTPTAPPVVEPPVVEPPITEPPTPEPPVVEPPIVEPPIIDPPITEPPTPEPPIVEPPVTEPPTPEPPVVEPPTPEPPIVDPPIIDPPVVDPPTVTPTYLVPASPYSITVLSVQRRTIVLGWGAPVDGGSPIIDYRIEASSVPSARFKPVVDSVSAATVAQIRKPTSARWYVRVTAVNAIGASTPSIAVRIRVR